MIRPTIGRIVWYHPEGGDPNGQPHAAQIAHVNEDDTINLSISDERGVSYPKLNVFLRQDGEANPFATTGGWAEWMPYQVGQAKAAAPAAPALEPVHARIDALAEGTQGKFEALGDWLGRMFKDFEQKLAEAKAPAAPAPAPALVTADTDALAFLARGAADKAAPADPSLNSV